MATRVDLNADMGESYGRWTLGDDDALMPHLTSANIACGFHGGDPHVMRKTVALALEHGVGIGAHVGLPGPDRLRPAAHGRHARRRSSDYVLYQAGALRAFVEAAGGRLQHVKPHGALYTMIVDSDELAQAVCEAVADARARRDPADAARSRHRRRARPACRSCRRATSTSTTTPPASSCSSA